MQRAEGRESEAQVLWFNFHFLQPSGLIGTQMHIAAAAAAAAGEQSRGWRKPSLCPSWL